MTEFELRLNDDKTANYVLFTGAMGAPQGEFTFAGGVKPAIAAEFAQAVCKVIDDINGKKS